MEHGPIQFQPRTARGRFAGRINALGHMNAATALRMASAGTASLPSAAAQPSYLICFIGFRALCGRQ